MRRYVKIFQQAEPANFRIHAEQVDVFTECLTNFIKPKVLLSNKLTSKLKSILLPLGIIYQKIFFLLVLLLVKW